MEAAMAATSILLSNLQNDNAPKQEEPLYNTTTRCWRMAWRAEVSDVQRGRVTQNIRVPLAGRFVAAVLALARKAATPSRCLWQACDTFGSAANTATGVVAWAPTLRSRGSSTREWQGYANHLLSIYTSWISD